MENMPQSCFPLRPGVEWAYIAMDPIDSWPMTMRVGPRQEIEIEDMVTNEVRKEQAWLLERSDRDGKRQMFAVERSDGVQLIEQRPFGKPERKALVVTTDLRWAGEATWSQPEWYYELRTIGYRRAGEEEVIVAVGAFRCLKILLNEGEDGTIWLAPEIGIVRSVKPIEGLVNRYAIMELHSYAVP